ncbi:hypothetical protein HGM15179_015687 [Zosterops borbonicus]|uniref:Uncharacterized protein n=1 Tax=Zosterops borbonicus TaxID=364589 RepID=A0A8K1G4L6_9PASS|nr:hypothetical protein HGM15179_015687 [Zosterops borbonicus]
MILQGCGKTPLGWDLSNDAGTTVERFFWEKSHLDQDDPTRKDNFQDQMKRELAYREEMVQQLQIVKALILTLADIIVSLQQHI